MGQMVEAEIIIKRRPGVSDPAGLAIVNVLHHLGYSEVESVTTGKYFLIAVDEQSADAAIQYITNQEIGHPSINEASVRKSLLD